MTAGDDFLSGESGHVAGVRALARTGLRDLLLDADHAARPRGRRAA
jgi:hypothetical protein